MKKLFTLIAAALLSIGSIQAQSFTLTIEGKEVKNGDNIEVSRTMDEVAKNVEIAPGIGFMVYELAVKTSLTSNQAQEISIVAEDLDKMEPGLACCPTGFTCSVANDRNGWKAEGGGAMKAGQKIDGDWIHYTYGTTPITVGTARKAAITFKTESETLSFNLTITAIDNSGVSEIVTDEAENAAEYSISGQRLGNQKKGIVVKKGKKYIAK